MTKERIAKAARIIETYATFIAWMAKNKARHAAKIQRAR